MSAPLILIGGGVRCGKSRYALERALQLGARRTFFATAQLLDPEMELRAKRHREERAARFRTVESPFELCEALARDDSDVRVVDCVTLWLSNLLLRGDAQDAILTQVERLIAVLRQCAAPAVLVTNEVGMGIVPDSELGRAFRDLSGGAHQHLAHAADEVYFGALGLLLKLKPGPLVARAPA